MIGQWCFHHHRMFTIHFSLLLRKIQIGFSFISRMAGGISSPTCSKKNPALIKSGDSILEKKLFFESDLWKNFFFRVFRVCQKLNRHTGASFSDRFWMHLIPYAHRRWWCDGFYAEQFHRAHIQIQPIDRYRYYWISDWSNRNHSPELSCMPFNSSQMPSGPAGTGRFYFGTFFLWNPESIHRLYGWFMSLHSYSVHIYKSGSAVVMQQHTCFSWCQYHHLSAFAQFSCIDYFTVWTQSYEWKNAEVETAAQRLN